MKKLTEVPWQMVYDYWKSHDGLDKQTGQLRPDIIGAGYNYPANTTWYSAQIEAADITDLYIISTPDFLKISNGTWLVAKAASNYPQGIAEQHHLDRINRLLAEGHVFDPRIIVVSHSFNGPFTIIEGNHRAMILQNRDELVEKPCFLGLHQDMAMYARACKAYRKCL